MQQLWRTLLAVLFPLDRLVRVLGILLEGLDYLDGLFADPEDTLENRRLIEGAIIFFEHWVNLLTAIRAADMLGLPPPKWDAPLHIWQPHTPRSWDDLIKRYTRMRLSFATIERHARRRAVRFKRERATSPLRLDAPHQSTSPSLRLVEDSVAMRELLHRLRRGRWIARPSAQDGGGSLRTRGPPSHPNVQNQAKRLESQAFEIAPSCPPATILTAAFTKKFDPPACEKHKKRTQQGTGTEQEHERAGQLLRCKRQLLQVRAFRR